MADSCYITRHEAFMTISELIDSGILDKDLEENLQSIANCIEAEETHNIFLWGAKDEAIDLFVAKMNPYKSSGEFTKEDYDNYDKWVKHCNELYEKYKIK